MIRHSARLVPVDWEQGLAEFAGRAAGSGLEWWLYGSAALAMRGLKVEPGDLDPHVSDAHLAGQLMSDLLVEPVTRMVGWVADAGGRAYAGVMVEWLAGAHPTGMDPPHEHEEAASERRGRIDWNGRVIAVPTLEVQLEVAERRSLRERAALIRAAMRH